MRKASAPVLFAVGLVVLLVVAGLSYVAADLTGLTDDDDGADVATITEETTTTTAAAVLAADQVLVTGVASGIELDGANIGEVVLPTITTPSAGLGSGARFENVTVDGEDSTVTWDAGRPLAFAAATPLRLIPVAVNLNASITGTVVRLTDSLVYAIAPGDYQIDAPVAVGTSGLAHSRDSATISCGDAATVSFTGAANATLPPGELTATGPGRVVLDGALQVHHPDGTVTDASHVELPSGSFRITFAPSVDGAGLQLTDALLEGALAP